MEQTHKWLLYRCDGSVAAEFEIYEGRFFHRLWNGHRFSNLLVSKWFTKRMCKKYARKNNLTFKEVY